MKVWNVIKQLLVGNSLEWLKDKDPVCQNNDIGIKKESSAGSRMNADPLLERLQRFLETAFEFRFNQLTEETEFRQRGENG